MQRDKVCLASDNIYCVFFEIVKLVTRFLTSINWKFAVKAAKTALSLCNFYLNNLLSIKGYQRVKEKLIYTELL